jgi:hypothetical protein
MKRSGLKTGLSIRRNGGRLERKRVTQRKKKVIQYMLGSRLGYGMNLQKRQRRNLYIFKRPLPDSQTNILYYILSTIYYITCGHPLILRPIYYILCGHPLILSTIYYIFKGPAPDSQTNILYYVWPPPDSQYSILYIHGATP